MELSLELVKFNAKCEKYAATGNKKKFQKLLTKMANLQLDLRDDHIVTIEQAAKDAAREKLSINGENYAGGWSELNRIRADLHDLCADLLARSGNVWCAS
jgi:hypothetical protein